MGNFFSKRKPVTLTPGISFASINDEKAPFSTYQTDSESKIAEDPVLDVPEDKNCIEVITPGARALLQGARERLGYSPNIAPMVGIILAAILEIPLLDTLSNVSNQLVFGALKTYPVGYVDGWNSANLTASQNYSLLIVNPTLADPYQYELNDLANHSYTNFFASNMAGFGLSYAIVSILNKPTWHASPANVLLMFMVFAASLISYGAFGGFTWMGEESLSLNEKGQELGLSNYGFVDGNNAYCPHVNRSHKCPDPSKYYKLLHDSLVPDPITQAKDNLAFTLGLLLVLSATLTTSALYYSYDKKCNRNAFNRARVARQIIEENEEKKSVLNNL